MTVPKLEILFCTDGIFPHAIGGMQRHSRLLIEELAKDEKLKLIVLHPHQDKKIFSDFPAITEIALVPDKKTSHYLTNCYYYSKKVDEVIQRYPDAIVYAQGLTVWHNIKKTGRRVILNPHGLEPYQTLSLKDKVITIPFRIIFGYLFKRAGTVVSLGGRLTEILTRLLGSQKIKIAILPNAVQVGAEMTRTCSSEPVRFLFVGRFAFNKGIGVLLEAVKYLNEQGFEKKIFFNLVGKGPLFEEYSEKYKAQNICFVGFADDDKLVEMYKSNDVFVLPTLFEGMPTVVLEAMTYSMPIIVTDVGATLELVDETNGYIIYKNSITSLVAAITAYLEKSPADRKRMADASYHKVREQFTWSQVAAKHKELFYRIRDQMGS